MDAPPSETSSTVLLSTADAGFAEKLAVPDVFALNVTDTEFAPAGASFPTFIFTLLPFCPTSAEAFTNETILLEKDKSTVAVYPSGTDTVTVTVSPIFTVDALTPNETFAACA